MDEFTFRTTSKNNTTTCPAKQRRPGRAAARWRTVALAALFASGLCSRTSAQESAPTLLDPNLGVRPAASGFVTPIGVAFLDTHTMLVLEKNTGKVQVVVDGKIDHTALDLAVNNSSERGLLSIALDPAFADNHFVYLYWTAPAPHPRNPFYPALQVPADVPTLGADTDDILAVPLLGNRVDRFVWNGQALTFSKNLVKLRAFQNDGAPFPTGQGDQEQTPAGNHDGGVIRFGPDGKLYVIIGDVGRCGQLQNLPSGPTATGLGPMVPDDQFGGPKPDIVHLTSVILRLNPDGTVPADNPFRQVSPTALSPGAPLAKVFAYGHRNSFGLAFDPLSGHLWMSENGDDSFDEINRVDAGFNSGWIQVMGPLGRLNQFKDIETSAAFFGLQQLRWPPTRIANTSSEALSRLFMLPGAHFRDPEFSWKYAMAPAALGFLNSSALGAEYFGDLFVGFSEDEPLEGPLFRFKLSADRSTLAFSDPRLADRVADNVDKHDMTESESLLVGTNFGIITDIQTGLNGNLFLVSLDKGVVYEIFRLAQNQQSRPR